MKIIKWSPIEFTAPYSKLQADCMIQNIKDLEKKAQAEGKKYYDEFGFNWYMGEEDPSLKLIKYLQENGNKIIYTLIENTEFLFYPKYIKGTFIVYTHPKTPFEN